MAKRAKLDAHEGPVGEKVNVSWMPGGPLRLDFVKCGPAVLTMIFTDPKTKTSPVELDYGWDG
jgi:hypothetical protein